MKIRAIEERDLEAASAICIESFSNSVAEDLSEEGIATFSRIASSDALLDRMKADNTILVAERNGRIEGVVELKEGRHVSMLFVGPAYQKKGVGRQLLSSVLNYARTNKVTVRASLPSVPVYEKCGFESRGGISESAGLVYQSMEIELGKIS